MSNEMNTDERAALVEGIRHAAFALHEDNYDEKIDAVEELRHAADLIEADGKRLIKIEESTTREVRLIQRRLTEAQREKAATEKRLALAEKTIADAPHGNKCNLLSRQGTDCDCWKAEYDTAKEAL